MSGVALVYDGREHGRGGRRRSCIGRAASSRGALLRHAQRAGAVRNDVELPEVYALLIATLAIVFDGLAPLRNFQRAP
ncbi:hypothetical protein [Streptomyces sp. NBC_01537]|uniref:SbtR family transcriptional regulator n=1 Tax=Streptomyces sp. NBC_01537 TaxID=2903896 RepID=UPI00386A33F3